ncbi:MAG: amidase [Acidobacteriota bacterium]|nr:amidase [Acidobacteriota bacterium]
MTKRRSEAELAFLSIEEAARLLRRREVSPMELVEAALQRIDRANSRVNAFLTVLAEPALRQARAAERELRRGRASSLLHGIPIALKDNFYTRGIRTTAGSKILADLIPKTNSDAAERLSSAGAILLGKTNMHEFAYGITSENPHYGPVHNPWALERISGGSSGGSAAAVAAGMCFAATGTDTGGSIRVPASLCGVVGLKPTYGLVSVAGTVPLAPGFDHVGPLARSVTDACIVLEAIAGTYPKGVPRLDHRALRKNRSRRIRIGWPREYYFERIDPDVRRVVERAAQTLAKALNARVAEVPLSGLQEGVEAATNVIVAEASYYHETQGYFPARAAEYGDDVRGHLEWGAKLRAVDYMRGLEKKREVEAAFDAAFESADAIVAPSTPIAAAKIGDTAVRVAGKRESSVRAELLRMTRPVNVSGHPAVSIPCGFTPAGLPVGLQLIGPKWGEAKLLAIALAYEDATDWRALHPELQ